MSIIMSLIFFEYTASVFGAYNFQLSIALALFSHSDSFLALNLSPLSLKRKVSCAASSIPAITQSPQMVLLSLMRKIKNDSVHCGGIIVLSKYSGGRP